MHSLFFLFKLLFGKGLLFSYFTKKTLICFISNHSIILKIFLVLKDKIWDCTEEFWMQTYVKREEGEIVTDEKKSRLKDSRAINVFFAEYRKYSSIVSSRYSPNVLHHYYEACV